MIRPDELYELNRRRVREATAALFARRGWPAPSAEAVERLATHFALLYRWNQRMNLTAIRDPEIGIRRHLLESLEAFDLLPPQRRAPDLLADLGTGNGYPALPLLILREDLRGLLIESSSRKVAFLRAAIRETDTMTRVNVHESRLADVTEISDPVSLVCFRGFPQSFQWVKACVARPSIRSILAWLSARDAQLIADDLRSLGHTCASRPLESAPGGALLTVRPHHQHD